jgi:hypothetical protein
MVKKQPVLITDAARSQSEEFRSRQIRYVTMMGMRAGCLILGGILISVNAPLLPVWLTLCVLGMIFLPWAAVLIANDRAPKKKVRRPVPVPVAPQRALTEDTPDEVRHRTIDVEP